MLMIFLANKKMIIPFLTAQVKMEMIAKNTLVFLLLLHFYLSCFFVEFGTAADTIRFNQSIKGSENIISNDGVFQLGFFNPVNSTNRYLGIRYAFSPSAVVWVANRDNPLEDNSDGILSISIDGNLVLSDAKGQVFWSSSNSTTSSDSDTTTASNNSSSTAQLLDSGNFVLTDSQGTIIWESFLHPTDTFLPEMRLSVNSKQNTKVQITSWKSISDPSVGSFRAGLEPRQVPEGFVLKGDQPYWRTGPWNGQYFLGGYDQNFGYHDGMRVVNDKNGTVSGILDHQHSSAFLRFVISWQGQLAQLYWSSEKKEWEVLSSGPNSCRVYGTCGAFGSCSGSGLSSLHCTCLRGFEPSNIQEWNGGKWTSGCVRRTPLQCERLNISSKISTKISDGFLKLTVRKVPDSMILSSASPANCPKVCLRNCSCTAYAYDSGIGCMLWSGNLIDVQQYPKGAGSDFHIRLAHSELHKRRNFAKTISTGVTVGTIAIASAAYFFYKCIYRRRVTKWRTKDTPSLGVKGAESSKFPDENMKILHNLNKIRLQELQLYSFEKLAVATNNFHPNTMLGRGGFGQVYRGKLEGGLEIAVKRLSRGSGQGLVEFTNEVLVISELQHRNLVKLFGCCVDGEEKMLIYEYLPNRSLDVFIFDPLRKELLDWQKRFNVIEGIGRGLLYLHRDSRVKIIHRDLKPSNILLDEDLNPKISDFGMAKIFQGNEDHGNTRRIVGTYGYMSPEYAIQGLFSEKSDVFSFGVLLLEIVSGTRNNSFRQHEKESFNLLQFAWKLWNEDNIIALTDPALVLSDQGFKNEINAEIIRCMQVGLLCVQESARNRPSMSNVLSMLNADIIELPIPDKPGFSGHRHTGSSSQLNHGKYSDYNVSMTTIYGR